MYYNKWWVVTDPLTLCCITPEGFYFKHIAAGQTKLIYVYMRWVRLIQHGIFCILLLCMLRRWLFDQFADVTYGLATYNWQESHKTVLPSAVAHLYMKMSTLGGVFSPIHISYTILLTIHCLLLSCNNHIFFTMKMSWVLKLYTDRRKSI